MLVELQVWGVLSRNGGRRNGLGHRFDRHGATAHRGLHALDKFVARKRRICGYLVHEVIGNPDWLDRTKAFILDGVEAGALTPVIATTFSFEQIALAHCYLKSNEPFGKVVVTL
ncbi:zinc-binding dehydrogenase [Paraburkholderia sp. J10-1]|uniref:zinc-binding dehydrogenase n=1 Tax=Paraburkholderia sp. J10-1 TaxID=2805430 RepID=UPI002AB601C7|nr:zinc-binding dehydrogenase [Paraburkholderia sp. J10-1]